MYTFQEQSNIINIEKVVTGITLTIGKVEQLTYNPCHYLAYSYDNKKLHSSEGFIFLTFEEAKQGIMDVFEEEFGL